METKVVCLKRKNGEIVQNCDIYIGRKITMGGWNLPQSKWANPFTIKECDFDVKLCIELYDEYLKSSPLLKDIEELRGKTLGCWCKKKGNELCHGDILVKILNNKIIE